MPALSGVVDAFARGGKGGKGAAKAADEAPVPKHHRPAWAADGLTEPLDAEQLRSMAAAYGEDVTFRYDVNLSQRAGAPRTTIRLAASGKPVSGRAAYDAVAKQMTAMGFEHQRSPSGSYYFRWGFGNTIRLSDHDHGLKNKGVIVARNRDTVEHMLDDIAEHMYFREDIDIDSMDEVKLSPDMRRRVLSAQINDMEDWAEPDEIAAVRMMMDALPKPRATVRGAYITEKDRGTPYFRAQFTGEVFDRAVQRQSAAEGKRKVHAVLRGRLLPPKDIPAIPTKGREGWRRLSYHAFGAADGQPLGFYLVDEIPRGLRDELMQAIRAREPVSGAVAKAMRESNRILLERYQGHELVGTGSGYWISRYPLYGRN